MEVAFAVVFVAGFLVAALLASRAVARGQVQDLRTFALRCLTQVEGRFDVGATGELWDVHVAGRLEGRRVRVSFERRVGDHPPQRTLRVAAPSALTGFEVTPTSPLTSLGRWLGLVPPPDGPASYEVKAWRDVLAARRLFQSREVREAIEDLMRLLGFREIRLACGWLEARKAHGAGATALHLEREARALLRLAKLCEQRPITITLGGVKVKRRGWTGGSARGASTFCPYCRDEVREDGDALAACERCETVHHAACLAEAGRCTVFGCGGGARQADARERERAP